VTNTESTERLYGLTKPFYDRTPAKPFNFRLILPLPQDSNRMKRSTLLGWMTKIAVTGLFTLRIIIPVAFIAAPQQAEASILSLVTGLFSAQAAAAGAETPDNSQKMALLEAPVNPNVHAGSGSTMHIQDDALVADFASTGSEYITQTNTTNEISTYKVQSGDTVSSIAKKFGISVNTIIWANNISRTSTLKEGQTLVILPMSGVQHKVRSGDTIETLAKKYKGDVDEIIAYNDITNEKLKIGDIIMIPDGELVAPASTGTTKPKTTTTTRKLASVAAGVGLAAANEIPDASGYYIRPLAGGVRTQGVHGNNGVDLAASCGVPVYASASGVVIVSKNDGGYNGGYGNYIVISHGNGSQTLYAHMQATSIGVGARVSQGDNIGLVGNSGKVYGATGCHVHFEIRNGIRNPF
jgi:murein DD-endopeptidase MepM/ murein hydrolase activator NlpD